MNVKNMFGDKWKISKIAMVILLRTHFILLSAFLVLKS